MLVFWKCETFFHTVIPVANEALKIMGEKTGAFQVTVVTDDYSVFNAETLKQFDAICLNNTTSLKFDPQTTPEQCQALMDFVKSGKGIIGIHAAADNFYQCPEAQEMMGNKFTAHPWGAGSTVAIKIDQPDHPLTAPFKGQGFKVKDEIYRTAPPLYNREKQFVLMSLDMSDPATRDMKGVIESDKDTGITWIKDVGKGRLFYCSLGHNDEIFMNTPILEHYLRGIQFAMGDFPVPTKPTGSAKGQDMAQGQTANALVEKVKAYDFGQSREALTAISDEIRKAYGKPEELKKFEASLIEVLKSDAKYAGKQYACRELSIIGTEQSVPVLAGMLHERGILGHGPLRPGADSGRGDGQGPPGRHGEGRGQGPDRHRQQPGRARLQAGCRRDRQVCGQLGSAVVRRRDLRTGQDRRTRGPHGAEQGSCRAHPRPRRCWSTMRC